MTIGDYACGAYELCVRDLQMALGDTAAPILAVLSSAVELPQAFGLRNEMCSLKKCTFFVLQQASSLERQLAQLSTFWHGEHVPCGRFFLHSERLEALSDARTRAKGACSAVQDARAVAKNICSLPRHPSKSSPPLLTGLPTTLQAWRIAEAALAAAGTSEELEIEPLASAPAAAPTTSWHSRCAEILRAQSWPEHITTLVEMVVLCRGGDKALRIRDAVCDVESALVLTIERLELAASRLDAMPSVSQVASQQPDDDKQLVSAMRRRRHSNLVAGCLPVMRDTLLWLRSAAEASQSGATRFVAGDGRNTNAHSGGERGARMLGFQPALCVWPSTKLHGTALFAALHHVEQTYRPQMRETIACSGWPEAIVSRRGAEREHAADNKVCRECTRQFSTLWVHRGVCSECEATLREGGQCPYQPERCSSGWFCVHSGRCFVCDSHGCAECRLERGGADTVAEVAARLDASPSWLSRIALDFDRTLANTKSGGAPVVGKHLIDEELLVLLWRYSGRCELVTRNGHTGAIRAFLNASGAPPEAELPIRTVRKGQSKADYVCAGEDGSVLFVDDSVAELAEARVAADSRVHRVLFVRALL